MHCSRIYAVSNNLTYNYNHPHSNHIPNKHANTISLSNTSFYKHAYPTPTETPPPTPTVTIIAKWGLVFRNVADVAESPTPKKLPPVTLTQAQVKRLLEIVSNDWLYPLYILAVTTGMREGELLGLHWDDIDLENGIIHVQHAIQSLPGKGLVLTEPKTEKSRR